MEYKHTTQKFVELIRRQAEAAYEGNEPVRLSPVALLAYIEEFEEMAARIAELEATNERLRKAADAGLRISQTGQESLRRIAELEAKLRIAESNFENLCYDNEHDGFDANNAV